MKTRLTNQQKHERIPVLFVVEGKPKLTGGQEVVWNILRNLDRNRFSPISLFESECPLSELVRNIGIEVIVLPFRDEHSMVNTLLCKVGKLPVLGWLPAQLLYICYRVKAWRILQNRHIRVVWCHKKNALKHIAPIAKILHIPVVWNVFNNPFRKEKSKLRVWLHRKLYIYLSDHIVLGYSKLKDEAFSNGNISFDTVYGGVKAPKIVNNVNSQKNPVVGIVGLIKETKRQEDFIQMASMLLKRNINAQFQIVGGTRTTEERLYESRLNELVDQLNIGDHVKFLGWVRDVYETMSQWSVFVFTSESEGLPRAILEAMHARVPIVSTNVGGIPEALIGGESGLLVSVGDIDGLADAVAFLIQHPDEARRLADNAFRRATELFAENVYNEYYENLFQQLDKGTSKKTIKLCDRIVDK